MNGNPLTGLWNERQKKEEDETLKDKQHNCNDAYIRDLGHMDSFGIKVMKTNNNIVR